MVKTDDIMISPLKDYYIESDCVDSIRIVSNPTLKGIVIDSEDNLIVDIREFFDLILNQHDVGMFCILNSQPWWVKEDFRMIFSKGPSFMSPEIFSRIKEIISTLYDAFLNDCTLDTFMYAHCAINGVKRLPKNLVKEPFFKLKKVHGSLYFLIPCDEVGYDENHILNKVPAITYEEELSATLVSIDPKGYSMFKATSPECKKSYVLELLLYLCPLYEFVKTGIFNFGNSNEFSKLSSRFKNGTETDDDIYFVDLMVETVLSDEIEDYFEYEKPTALVEQYLNLDEYSTVPPFTL